MVSGSADLADDVIGRDASGKGVPRLALAVVRLRGFTTPAGRPLAQHRAAGSGFPEVAASPGLYLAGA
jgi:hypothetical protein